MRRDIRDQIARELERLNPAAADRAKNYRFSDAGILVAMQKLYDIPFVPPIDVPTGSKTDIKELRQRQEGQPSNGGPALSAGAASDLAESLVTGRFQTGVPEEPVSSTPPPAATRRSAGTSRARR